MPHAEQHVRRIRILHDFPISSGRDPQGLEIRQGPCRQDARSDGAEAVETFRVAGLATGGAGSLPVAGRDVVADREAEDVVEGVLLGDVERRPRGDKAELVFVVNVTSVEFDSGQWPCDAAGEFTEDDGVLRQGNLVMGVSQYSLACCV